MMLSFLIVIPLLAAFFCLFFPKRARDIALWCTSLLLLLGIGSLFRFSTSEKTMQFVQEIIWMKTSMFDVVYHVGVDGISYPLVLLTLLLGVVAVLVSRREIHTDEGALYALLLGLIGCVIGVFVNLHLILFFVFWEAVLVLMFLLILRWGGENKKYAAMKFLIYTGIGSGALLLVIILLGIITGSLDILLINSALLSPSIQYLLFGLLLFAFFIKIPIVPFHTWLPDAHVEAPTAGSVLLAGVLLKMGAYGLLRLGLGILSDVTGAFGLFLFIMGTITILYGAFVCLAQRNLKRLIAYSSINHMGFVLLGIAAGSTLGVTGAVFEMVSHGLIAGLLFALAGFVHQRTGTFDLDALHGLVQKMPKTSWFLVIAALGGLGLPSMTGFIAEFLVLFASFQAYSIFALLPLSGVVLTGGYMVRMLTKAVFGKQKKLAGNEHHASMLPFGLLTAMMFVLGLLPFLLINIISASLVIP